MKHQTQQSILLGLFLVLLAGCQSAEFTRYISPQISGRVLAADTRQPLAGANVTRITPENAEAFGPPKGGQLLTQSSGVRTAADGRFVLEATSVFSVFRQPGWWSVPVKFSCAGYQTFKKSYTGTNITSHSSSGVPMLDTGDVVLQPLPR